jgi:hypothetical protein
VNSIDKETREARPRSLVNQVASEHRFTETIFADENQIFVLANELKREESFNAGTIILGNATPIEVGHRPEPTSLAVFDTTLNAPLAASSFLVIDE